MIRITTVIGIIMAISITFVIHIINVIPITMKKLLSISTELNAKIRIDAMQKGTTANAIIIGLLMREYMDKTGTPAQPLEVLPVKDTPEQKPVEEKPTTEAHLRKGEVKEEHKHGMFLQRKQHSKGILSNGECLRIATEDGFKYAYFAEDLKQY
jgi:hypothetical protein